eukprot:6173284-Pleurochrysis_carterae.AAC.1
MSQVQGDCGALVRFVGSISMPASKELGKNDQTSHNDIRRQVAIVFSHCLILIFDLAETIEYRLTLLGTSSVYASWRAGRKHGVGEYVNRQTS